MEDRAANLALRIKELKLSPLVLFLLVAHLPLRGLFSNSVEAFHPLLKFVLGEGYAEEVRWFLECPDRIQKLCNELEK